jgi:putative flippase GtrA
VFIGGMGFVVDFGTLFFLTLMPFFQSHYLLATTIAFVLGLTVNYIFSIRWVFNKRSFDNKALEFLVFTLVGVVGLALNWLFIWLFTDHIFVQLIPVDDKQLRIIGSKIISTAIVYFWNFSARKWILFR